MKLYQNKTFKLAYPIGGGAVVLAIGPYQAAAILEKELEDSSVPQIIMSKDMVEIDLTKLGIVYLDVGAY